MGVYLLGSATMMGSADPAATGAGGIIGAAMLTDLCDIETDTLADDGQGSSTLTPVSIATSVPCSLEKAVQGTEKVTGGNLQATERFTLKVPVGTDLQPSYRVLKGGMVYQCVDTDAGLTSPLFLAATVVRVRNQG